VPAPERVTKAFAYVTRGHDLLVFRHRDEPFEESGLQVPAGTVRPAEPLAEAALREAAEETGLAGLVLASYLGQAEYDVRPAGWEVHERHFFHLLAPPGCPDTWVSFERHDGVLEPTAFVCSWLPIVCAHTLSAGMGALLSALPTGPPDA